MDLNILNGLELKNLGEGLILNQNACVLVSCPVAFISIAMWLLLDIVIALSLSFCFSLSLI